MSYVEQMRQPTPPVPDALLSPRLHDFALTLFELGAVQFGDFTLTSGKWSPVYIDLRLLISHPPALAQAAQRYADLIRDLPADRLSGVPYAALPLGTAASLEMGVPLIYPRKEAKSHGRGKQIEGEFQTGDRVIVIEDLVTTAGSLIQSIDILRGAGLIVEHAAVIIDREQGGAVNLARHGVQLHAAMTFSQLLRILRDAGRIDQAQYDRIRTYLNENP